MYCGVWGDEVSPEPRDRPPENLHLGEKGSSPPEKTKSEKGAFESKYGSSHMCALCLFLVSLSFSLLRLNSFCFSTYASRPVSLLPCPGPLGVLNFPLSPDLPPRSITFSLSFSLSSRHASLRYSTSRSFQFFSLLFFIFHPIIVSVDCPTLAHILHYDQLL